MELPDEQWTDDDDPDPFAAFTEWASDEEEEAYADL